MTISKLVIAAFAALVSGVALAQDGQLRDLSVEQNIVAQAIAPRLGSLKVTLTTDRPDATYAAGEMVRLTLQSNEDAYITVFDIGPSGQVTQLFPNQFQSDNKVAANRAVEIGGGNVGARIVVSAPFGTELIKVIASSKPLTIVPAAQLQSRGAFRSLDGGAQALVRDLQVVANQPAQDDLRVSMTNFGLYTVASRAPAQPVIVLVPGQPAPTTVAPVVVPQASPLVTIPVPQPFPLLVAVDKASFRIGETVTLAVTSMQACNLTVLDVAPNGQVRTLFPNAATPANAVQAMQTVIVAGGPSAISLQVAGPAGTEQIVAICSTEATPVAAPAEAGADRAALARDLSVVAGRPTGTTAMASVSFSVLP